MYTKEQMDEIYHDEVTQEQADLVNKHYHWLTEDRYCRICGQHVKDVEGEV